jgi:hypothetical protein
VTEISATAQTGASPQHVWAILADLASYPQWNPLFREASGQLTAGSTVTLKSVRPGTERVMTVKVKLLAAEPGAQLRWISALPGIITGEHSFARRVSQKAGLHPATTFTAEDGTGMIRYQACL